MRRALSTPSIGRARAKSSSNSALSIVRVGLRCAKQIHASSLDAPLVALSWGAVLGHWLRGAVDWQRLLLLMLGVWLAYAGDRWLDGRRLDAGHVRAARHRFSRRHRLALFAIWCVVLALGAALAPRVLTLPGELARAVSIAAGAALFVWLGQMAPRAARVLVPRELVVGGSFAWVVFVFALPGDWSAVEVALCIGFALLCALEALHVSSLEACIDAACGEATLFVARPAWSAWVRPALAVLAASAAAAALLAAERGPALVAIAIALAAFSLLAFERVPLAPERRAEWIDLLLVCAPIGVLGATALMPT